MNIAVFGMGYVGLPLAISLSKYFTTYGYDIDAKRIEELKKNVDKNQELNLSKIKKKIIFTNKVKEIGHCTVFIICVPTPVFKNNKPDLKPLRNALKKISKIIKINDLIIIESTVYPGVSKTVTNEILSYEKNYKLNKDYYLGYSPERVNPGDKKNSLNNITKIVSVSSPKKKTLISNIYKKITIKFWKVICISNLTS